MPASFIWKPATRKGPVLLVPSEGPRPSTITITGPDGEEYVGRYYNTNEGRHQYVFERDIYGKEGLSVNYNGQSGTIENANQSYEGNGLDAWRPRAKGSLGAGGDYPEGYAPGTDPTGLGFYPADISGEYPSPVLANFDPIEAAPYNFTDVQEFAKKYGEFNREELLKNNALSKDFALDALDTELRGLQGYVPGAAALKRRETSLDNLFNQAERERQIAAALPNARGDLEAQRRRANIYARGGVPDEVVDRGLEIGIRSAAADRASSGGFGASSSVSRKAQDLMTARERIALGFQGESLLGQNLATSSNLLLAPTEYSNAGQQISVMPSLSGSQLQTQARGEINQATLVSPGQALQETIQQNQFTTNLEQATRTFNAGNLFDMSKFNAGVQNQFALGLFDYKANLAGAIAGAAQTGSNTQIQIEQQQAALDLYKETLKAAQQLKNIQGIFSGLGSLLGSLGGLSGVVNAIKGLGDLFGGGSANTEGIDPDTGGVEGSGEYQPGRPDPSDPGYVTASSADTSGIDEGGGIEGPDGNPVVQGPTNADGTYMARRAAIKNREAELDAVANSKTPDEAFANATKYGKLSPALSSAGLSRTPGQGKALAYYDDKGRAVYTDVELAKSKDISVGKQRVDTFYHTLNPFGIFDKEGTDTLTRIGDAASDIGFLGTLTSAYERGDKKAFANAIINRFQGAATAAIFSDPKNRYNANSIIDAAQLFTGWGSMSPAQRSMAVANLGLRLPLNNGQPLATVKIISPTGNTPGLNVGQAMNLFAQGYNVYNLVQNWNQLDDLNKIVGASNTVAGIVSTGESLGLIGGTTATAAGTGAAAGTTAAAGTGTAAGTTTAAGTGVTLGGAATVVGGVGSIALGAHQVRKNWGRGGAQGRAAGITGGLAMAAGLTAMTGGSGAPIAAGLFAIGVLGTSIKTGKHSDQLIRDQVRKHFQETGLTDEKHRVTLADGSKFDIGVDGNGGQHTAANPQNLVGDKRSKMNAYDIDYTNDLDYASGMVGVALSRLSTGEASREVDKLGGQLGNAALSSVGYGKQMTPENFDRVMQNQRALYAQRGIKNKAEAYKLSIDMLNDGRVDAAQAVAMQQAFNMMYDRDGYRTAQKLMAGRMRGIEVAANKPDSIDPGFNKPKPGDTSGTRRPTFDKPESIDPGFSRKPPSKDITAGAHRYGGFAAKLRSREEVIQANRQRYA